MAEQFLRGWAVDSSAVATAIGSNDKKILARAKRSDLAEELEELFDDDSDEPLDDQLAAIIAGEEPIGATWSTLRCFSLLAEALGSRVDDEMSLPGRGWQDLGPAWKHWGLRKVGTLWAARPKWAKEYDDWPVVMLAKGEALPALRAELESFDPQVVVERQVPKSVPRFGDGGWAMTDLVKVIRELRSELLRCSKAAIRKKTDLVLFLDGAQ